MATLVKSRSGGRRDLGRQVYFLILYLYEFANLCSERADAGILLPAYRLTLFSVSKGAAEGMKILSPIFPYNVLFTSCCSIALCIIHCVPLLWSRCFFSLVLLLCTEAGHFESGARMQMFDGWLDTCLPDPPRIRVLSGDQANRFERSESGCP